MKIAPPKQRVILDFASDRSVIHGQLTVQGGPSLHHHRSETDHSMTSSAASNRAPRRETHDRAPRSPPDRCRSGQRLPSRHPLDTRHRGPGRREQRAISLKHRANRLAATPKVSIAPRIRWLRTGTGCQPRALGRPLLRPANTEQLALALGPEQTQPSARERRQDCPPSRRRSSGHLVALSQSPRPSKRRRQTGRSPTVC